MGFCGEGRQRSVSWGDLHLGFVDQEFESRAGFIVYSMSARRYVGNDFVTVEDPVPRLSLPGGISLLDDEAEACARYGEDLSATTNHPVDEGVRVAFLDLGGPWPVILWFDAAGSSRITRIESTPCGE